jgi:hypothetical protein
MYYDIAASPDAKSALDNLLRRWLTDARTAHEQMMNEWNDADNYFENDQVPASFTADIRGGSEIANDPAQQQVESKQYIVVNKARETHESILGDFIASERQIIATGRTPKDRKFAKVIQRAIERTTDDMMLFEEQIVPMFDCGVRRGNHWLKFWHDPTQNLPYGRIVGREVSCRDILIDPDSRHTFYRDAKYVIHRQRFEVEFANERFRELLGPDVILGPDREHEAMYQQKGGRGTQERFCTIYEFQWSDMETRYRFVRDDGDMDEISREEFMAHSSNPQMASRVFKQMEEVFYVSWFNDGIGAFYNAENDLQRRNIVPFINIRSESRVYGIGDSLYYKQLQDLLNVLVSVLLDNAKGGNNPWITVDPQSYAMYAEEINEALQSRGRKKAIPAERVGHIYPREINQAVINLLALVEKYIYGLQARGDATRGMLPAKQIAEGTVEMLIQEDRKSHGRKDVMVKWTLTETARLLFTIIKSKYTDPMWMKVTDTKAGDADFVPINYVVTEQEYQQLLMQMAGLSPDMVRAPQDLEAFQQQLMVYRMQFEKENEVVRKDLPIFRIADETYDASELPGIIESSGLDDEEFYRQYRPEEGVLPVYVINSLERDTDIDIIWTVDFNAERDRNYRRQESFALFDRGAIRGDRLMKDIDYPDPEQAWKEAVESNSALQIGTQIIKDPEVYETVMQVLQRHATGGGGNKKTGKKK